MVVCKILLFFLAVVALNARQSQSHVLLDSTKDCACFPTDKNNIRISQLAETYGKHERRVIYLFRHLDSQKITIYIPNEEKQLNFPDLMVNSFESYDLHKQPHLFYIFDNPSTMVTVGAQLNYVVTNDKHNERYIYQQPTVKPTVNEIEVVSTDLHHGQPGYVVIDNENNQPSNVYPNTGGNKLPLTLHDPNANLVPGYEKTVVDHLNPQEKPSSDTLNLIPGHGHDHDLHPKQIVNEIEVVSTDLHHGEPGYVVIDNEKNQPSNVYPNTGGNKWPLIPHDHNPNSVTVVPGYELLNPQDKPSVDILHLLPQHGHDLHPEQSVNEIKVDSTDLHPGEPGYVIIDNEKNQPSNVYPNTGDRNLPWTHHEHNTNSENFVPGYENIFEDLLKPEKPEADILNLIPEHDLHTKQTVNEITIDSTGLHHGQPGYVIMDNEKNQPGNVHPNAGEHEHTPSSVTLVPGLEKIVIDYLNGQKKDGVVTLKPTTGPGNDQYVQYIKKINVYDNPKDSALVESGRNIVVLDLYDKTANPLDLSNLNQNTKNIHGDSINEIEIIDIISMNNNSYELPNKQESSVSTIQKDRERIILDNTKYSPVTGYNFINRVQELLSQNVLPSSINLKLVNNPVVEKWLITEINNIRNSGSGTLPLLTIDLNEIKIRLVQILTQNGFQFSENGYLLDVHGHIFKVTNLSLRRVLISDPVSYKKLLGRKCVTPLEIPYLEAIFVSLVHPAKVLGLIPLKMSSLSGCKRSKCTSRPCHKQHHKHVSRKPKLPSNLNLAPIFDKGVNDRQVVGPRIADEEDDKNHHNTDDDDLLDIRIIGGNPATGSGTPVSSRGRSGHRQSESLLSK